MRGGGYSIVYSSTVALAATSMGWRYPPPGKYWATVVRARWRCFCFFLYLSAMFLSEAPALRHLRPHCDRAPECLPDATSALTAPCIGAEWAAVERFHEGVGRGAQKSDEDQHPLDILTRFGRHHYCYRRRGVVTRHLFPMAQVFRVRRPMVLASKGV